jgi:hypothetical protein
MPTKNDMPLEAAKLAYLCSGKLWIEAYKLGYWEQAYDYDIISSFPSEIVKLIDFRKCEWVQSKEFVERAIYGYTEALVTIYDNVSVSPIIYIDKQGSSSTPTGTWRTNLTEREIDFIRKWKIGEVEILDGWWCCYPFPKYLARPLENVVERLLQWKAKGGLQNMLAKRMSVGVYGKLGEDRGDKVGPHFNPCWFAEVSTNIRLKVAEFVYLHKLQQSLIHVSIDGVLATKEIAISEEESHKSGWWKLSETGSVLVFSSGNIFMGKKKPKGLYLGDVVKMFLAHPKQGYYETKVPRIVTLGDALAHEFEDLGTEKLMATSLDFYRVQHEREFTKLPHGGGQLLSNKYQSKPKKVKPEVDTGDELSNENTRL